MEHLHICGRVRETTYHLSGGGGNNPSTLLFRTHKTPGRNRYPRSLNWRECRALPLTNHKPTFEDKTLSYSYFDLEYALLQCNLQAEYISRCAHITGTIIHFAVFGLYFLRLRDVFITLNHMCAQLLLHNSKDLDQNSRSWLLALPGKLDPLLVPRVLALAGGRSGTPIYTWKIYIAPSAFRRRTPTFRKDLSRWFHPSGGQIHVRLEIPVEILPSGDPQIYGGS